MTTCPDCGKPGMRVMYFGLPVQLCRDESCGRVWGRLSWLLEILPFNGAFVAYKKSYIAALWAWLCGRIEDGDV